MPLIDHSIDIDAARDMVWDIVSDLEHEYEYWYGTKDVRVISENGNVMKREITQNFRNHKILQEVVLHPKDSIEIEYVKGLTEGKKIIYLVTKGVNLQNVRVLWDVHFTGLFWLLTPWLKKHTEKGTIGALNRIKAACEGGVSEEGREKTNG